MSIRIDEVLDPNYVAVPLFPNHRVVCGTPAYFRRHVTPDTPEDLARHNCLALNLQGGQQRGWTFQRDGKRFAVRVDGDLACNDGELPFDWVRQELGIGWRSTWEIQAVYPQQRYLPAKIRYFIDFLKEIYNRPGYWEGQRV